MNLTRQAVEQLDRGMLIEAPGCAARAAAITCSRRGAELPYLDEVPAN